MDSEQQGILEPSSEQSALYYGGAEEPRIPAWLLVAAVALLSAAASFAFKWLSHSGKV